MGFALQEFFNPWLNGTDESRQRFLSDPRAAMSEVVGVPNDIEIAIEVQQGSTWFRASIPKEPTQSKGSLGDMQQTNERLQKCPALGVSGSEFIRNHVSILAEHGIRVPEDVLVEIDHDPRGRIHFKVPLDRLLQTPTHQRVPDSTLSAGAESPAADCGPKSAASAPPDGPAAGLQP